MGDCNLPRVSPHLRVLRESDPRLGLTPSRCSEVYSPPALPPAPPSNPDTSKTPPGHFLDTWCEDIERARARAERWHTLCPLAAARGASTADIYLVPGGDGEVRYERINCDCVPIGRVHVHLVPIFDVLAHMRFRVPIRFRFVSSSPSLTKSLRSPFYIHSLTPGVKRLSLE